MKLKWMHLLLFVHANSLLHAQFSWITIDNSLVRQKIMLMDLTNPVWLSHRYSWRICTWLVSFVELCMCMYLCRFCFSNSVTTSLHCLRSILVAFQLVSFLFFLSFLALFSPLFSLPQQRNNTHGPCLDVVIYMRLVVEDVVALLYMVKTWFMQLGKWAVCLNRKGEYRDKLISTMQNCYYFHI